MADRVLCITWNAPVRGAEERATETFNEAIGLLGRMQQEGRIEGFDAILLAPNGDLGGAIIIRGSTEQINAIREDEEFVRNTIQSQLCVDGIRHLLGWGGEGVATQMGHYQEAVAAVSQRS